PVERQERPQLERGEVVDEGLRCQPGSASGRHRAVPCCRRYVLTLATSAAPPTAAAAGSEVNTATPTWRDASVPADVRSAVWYSPPAGSRKGAVPVSIEAT